MPPGEKSKLAQELQIVACGVHESATLKFGGIGSPYDTWSKAEVQGAQASVEADRIMMLHAIEQVKGFHRTNVFVNDCFRNWVRSVIAELLKVREQEII